MDIVEFFQLSSGRWFSQRTSHHVGLGQTESSKSDLQIERLSQSDPEVLRLCEQYAIDPTLALCGVRVTADGTTEAGKKKPTSHTVLVPIADPAKPNEGTLLHTMGDAKQSPIAGRYVIGNDAVLTLTLESETTLLEERVWFASENLRFRTSLLKQSSGFSLASFCSEIRKGVTKPAEAEQKPSIEQRA